MKFRGGSFWDYLRGKSGSVRRVLAALCAFALFFSSCDMFSLADGLKIISIPAVKAAPEANNDTEQKKVVNEGQNSPSKRIQLIPVEQDPGSPAEPDEDDVSPDESNHLPDLADNGMDHDTEAIAEQSMDIVITTDEDAPVQVSISFSSEAGIPEGTELIVVDQAEALQALPPNELSNRLKAPARISAAPLNTALTGIEDLEFPLADVSLEEWQAVEEAPEIQLYHRTLDISLSVDGEEIEPEAEVEVTVILPDLEEGLGVTVRHQTEEGLIELESRTEGQAVTFTTDSFSLFDFSSTAQKIFSWTTDLLENTIFGSGQQSTTHSTITVTDVLDGLSVLEAFSVTRSSDLWLSLQRISDLILGKLESICLYTVKDGRLDALVKENIGLSDVLRLSLSSYSDFALVRDSGLRNKVAELGNVILSGFMPKNGTAEAVDVTGEYADFVGSESTSNEEEDDEGPGSVSGDEQGEADEDLSGQGVSEDGESEGETHTIAAYDISIMNDGEEYQPEGRPIEVTIKDEQIATAVDNGNAISLWHVLDDGTVEQITDFTITGDTVIFDATGFSVYVLTETRIEKILTAVDGKVYKITVTYDGSARIPEDAKLVVEEMDEEAYLADTVAALNTEADYLLYRKFLDISFLTADDTVIEPAKPVKVKIELMDVEAGADRLQVVHFGADGAEKVESQANSNAVVTFSSGEFSVFGFGNVLEPLAMAETDQANIEILGFGGDTHINAADAPAVEEGLEVLGAYTLGETGEEPLWIKADVKDGVELSSMESVAIYAMNGEKAADGAVELAEEQSGEAAEAPGGEEQIDTPQITELAEAGTIAELHATEFVLVKDSGYRHLSFEINIGGEEAQTEDDEESQEKEEETGKIILDGMMPKRATAEAIDVTDAYADHEYVVPEESADEETPEASVSEEEPTEKEDSAKDPVADEVGEEKTEDPQTGVGEEQKRITLAAFNITISNNDSEYQPDADHPIKVEIRDSRIVPGENIELWHIKDDGTEERVKEFTVQKDRVEFVAKGFSAYAIVDIEFPEVDFGWKKISSFSELISKGAEGLYMGHPDGFYFMNTTTADNRRVGITKTKPSQSSPPTDKAALYYFEQVEGTTNQLYVYCFDTDENKQYIFNNGNNSLSFTKDEESKTAFTVTMDEKNNFKFSNEKWYWNMQGGSGGARFCSYDNANDNNNNINIWYYASTARDPYDLGGKTYGLMHWNGGVAGKGLMATSTNVNALDTKAMEVLAKKNGNVVERLYVPSDSDISMWTFHWIANDTYQIITDVDGITYYLVIDAHGASLTALINEASIIQVIPGGGAQENQICLEANGYSLIYSGSINGGFTNSGAAGNEWLYLVDYSELTSDYLVTYSAQKVSVSDSTVTTGSRVIVYTRTWNDTLKKYEFYAVDHDGSLVECFESGDHIQWIGNRINSLLWDFTEYYWEGTTDPNYYYELYNEYSGKYIAPQIAGNQILSSSTIGINMPGRRDVAYHSTILAWDELHQAFVGLKASDNNSIIESCDIDEAGSFYFAIVQDANIEDITNTVETVDNNLYGIKMKLVDCEQPYMNNVMGSTGDANGLLSTNLNADGYPTITNNNNSSLGILYSDAKEVNHLFVESTYYASGYYEYDSTQNFASLKGKTGGDFTVYQELGTHDDGDKPTLKHGQFLPFNDIQAGLFAVKNPQNLYSALASIDNKTQGLLSDSDPRKYERLYLVKDPNFYFAVEMEASFVQTPSGLDAWGHDIIYEFTGDDDFWLYVDGELVIDLSGIHSAQWGKVNFKTGVVTGSKGNRNTTLRAIFENNYKARNPGASSADVSNYLAQYFDEGEDWFKDYTTHSMKIFYMERGAGASNLHMRFNLASVKDGTIELSKKLSGVSDTETLLAEFPYQIFYKEGENTTEKQLTPNTTINGEDDMTIRVKYKDTDNDVTYKSSITVDGITYNDVYMLKPDETAVIEMPDDGIYYRIVECGVNKDVYSGVTTREEIPVTETQGDGYSTNRADYGIEYAMTRSRTRVTYINSVNPDALRTLEITKKLFDVTGENEVHDDDTTFNFRLSLDYEYNDTTTLANMFIYHVKDQNGNYCYWDVQRQRFIAINDGTGQGISDYTSLNETQQKQASFNTSIYGSISHIPVDYTIEIRELLVGTKYKVEERKSEIPDGYSLQKYELNLIESDNHTTTPVELADTKTPVSGTIMEGIDPHVNVCNIQGHGIRIYKSWLDEDYMDNRSSAYFAVYQKDDSGNLTLVPETIMEMEYRTYTLYWYFQELNDIDFKNYVIREVSLTNPTVDSEGYVTNYDSITPVEPNGKIYIQGTQKGENNPSFQEYTVTYNQGSLVGENNVRIDYVMNSRSGLVIRKEDFEGNPLDESTFTLVDASGDLNATYTSDPDGYITTAFLRTGVEYTLTETKAKTGHHGLEASITITKDADGIVSVSGIDSMFYSITNNTGTGEPILTIKNKAFTFAVLKQDSVTGEYLAGAHFSLYRQITVGGVTLIDFNPMTGYEDLVTENDGIVPDINQSLPAGTYELREITAPAGYEVLSSGIVFTLDDLGTITLGRKHPADTVLEREDSEDRKRLLYTLKIPNSADSTLVNLMITKTVKGDMGDRSQNFAFSLESVEDEIAGTEYGYTITKADGTTLVPWYLTTEHGQNEFYLAHGESIVISVPIGKSVVFREKNGYYTTDWVLDGTALTVNADNEVEVTLTEEGILAVTNTMNAVAPTGFSTRHTPWLLLLLFGLMLLMGGGVVAKRKRGDDPDDGGTAAVNHTPLNIGPLGGQSPTSTKHTRSTPDRESCIRWQNSVWAEETPQRCESQEHGMQVRSSQRGYVPPQVQRTNISCPQAKLWMTNGRDDTR